MGTKSPRLGPHPYTIQLQYFHFQTEPTQRLFSCVEMTICLASSLAFSKWRIGSTGAINIHGYYLMKSLSQKTLKGKGVFIFSAIIHFELSAFVEESVYLQMPLYILVKYHQNIGINPNGLMKIGLEQGDCI